MACALVLALLSPDVMLFCSLEYVGFLAALFAAYWALPWPRARVYLLLGASFWFYARWNEWLALLVVGTTCIDYLLALGLDRVRSANGRQVLLWLSLGMNLGVLVYFKYANFFLESLAEMFRSAGLSPVLPVLEVVLPIGISFYTFEAINYTVDVFRGRIRAERDLGSFLLFILFFPHLIAGPIVRAKDFLPQIKRRKRWSWPRLGLGLWLIILGTFKKLAIADRMALFVDPVFADPGAHAGYAIALAAIAFALQVYCDFSGYSDIALGSAHLLGYKLTINFRLPFLAVNIADFWKRWHISLSTWLRDYLFIPLGGSRGSRYKLFRNLLIVMTLGGLWHGASWNCVLWGFSIGALLVGHKIFADWAASRQRLLTILASPAGTALRIALTFSSFVLTLVIFRAASIHDMEILFRRMFVGAAGTGLPLPAFGLVWTMLVVGAAHGLGAILSQRRLSVWRWVGRAPAPAIGAAAAAMLNLALLMSPASSKVFIYFQF